MLSDLARGLVFTDQRVGSRLVLLGGGISIAGDELIKVFAKGWTRGSGGQAV